MTIKTPSGAPSATAIASGTDSLRTLAVPDMAQLLKLSETTIRTYATAQRYLHLIPRPFKRPGGRRLLWREQDVLKWLESGRPASVPPPPRRPRGRPTKAEQAARARKQTGGAA